LAKERGFVEHLQSQSGLGAALSFRKMSGEYAPYLGGKVVAFACDKRVTAHALPLPAPKGAKPAVGPRTRASRR